MLTGSLVDSWLASRVLLQRFQPGDHRLDARARLFVLRQQLRAFADQLLLLLAQAAVLVGQALRMRGELVEAGGQRTAVGRSSSARSMAAR